MVKKRKNKYEFISPSNEICTSSILDDSELAGNEVMHLSSSFTNTLPAAATRRAAATSTLSAAATAHDAPPRIRLSNASPSATWLNLLLFVRLYILCANWHCFLMAPSC